MEEAREGSKRSEGQKMLDKVEGGETGLMMLEKSNGLGDRAIGGGRGCRFFNTRLIGWTRVMNRVALNHT